MNATQRTERLLHLISYHLSTRKQCRNKEYRVNIHLVTVTNGSLIITVDPALPMLDSRTNRYERSLLAHIFKYHMPELYGKDLRANTFVPGTYIYKQSVNHKYRKWTKELAGGART